MAKVLSLSNNINIPHISGFEIYYKILKSHYYIVSISLLLKSVNDQGILQKVFN